MLPSDKHRQANQNVLWLNYNVKLFKQASTARTVDLVDVISH